MRSTEATGRTVDEAVEKALNQLGVGRDEVEIEVLEEGSKGFLGFLGARAARVRVSVLPSVEDKLAKVLEFLTNVVEKMGIDARVFGRIEGDSTVLLELTGDNLGLIIGRRGQTLDSLQYLCSQVANRMEGKWVRVVLDAEGYRERRARTLERLAGRIARRVKESGRRAALEPMTPQERRIIHLALKDDPDVETHSEGEEPYRRVIITVKEPGSAESSKG